MPTAQQLLRDFLDSKTLPHVALRLSKLISDEGSRVREFEGLIKMDPVLVSRLLRMVNSPYYGVRENITSIARAIVFIGMKNLRNIVVIEGLKDAVRQGSRGGMFSRRRLWLHSIAVSICSQMIVERIFGLRGEDAFLCGILHDIGMIVEDQTAPELFARTWKTMAFESRPLLAVEKEIIGTDHCEVGALLVQDWKLPEEVREGIRRHHAFDASTTPNSMAGTIQLSEFFAIKLGYGALQGAAARLPSSLAAHVKGRLQEYRLLARDFPAQMAAAQDLYDHPED
jgi:putative nucleotidyltransferase with HDIG domain